MDFSLTNRWWVWCSKNKPLLFFGSRPHFLKPSEWRIPNGKHAYVLRVVRRTSGPFLANGFSVTYKHYTTQQIIPTIIQHFIYLMPICSPFLNKMWLLMRVVAYLKNLNNKLLAMPSKTFTHYILSKTNISTLPGSIIKGVMMMSKLNGV